MIERTSDNRLSNMTSTIRIDRRITKILLLDECLVDIVEYTCEEMWEIEDKEKKHCDMIKYS